MINLTLRILLIIGSLVTLLYMLIRIRISRMQIRDSIFWILFLLSLLLFSVFPGIAVWFSKLLQIQSPINFILLFVVFVIIIQLFFISMKLSKTDSSVRALTTRIAIDNHSTESEISEQSTEE
ncbi:MAG: DUF2304 domain-containing protein [Oscillospiraceae bacterium]|nr:DUF2304 domain-containing protein [Oscillospiraceae bacterium]